VKGYTAREVEAMLGLPAAEVRAWVRAGLLAPERGPRGEMLFSFQDLVLLRTAKGLIGAEVPRTRVRNALRKLRAQLPPERPLTGVHISAEGHRIVVSDGRTRWQPESGQALFDFGVAELEREVESLSSRTRAPAVNAEATADWYYEQGCSLEESDRDGAIAAYERAVELEPNHADAHINLGRMHHDAGRLDRAEAHYRLGLSARPDDVTAAFNLGVALEDLGRLDDALGAMRRAVEIDPGLADAYYNLSRLCEKLGHRAEALRYLHDYRKLTR
jgi:tetratricopeptide (TPR) repeat protein